MLIDLEFNYETRTFTSDVSYDPLVEPLARTLTK